MSVSSISSSNFLNYNTQSIQSQMQQFRQEFQQLGQDLQSGNLSAAQSDLSALQQLNPQAQTSASQSNNPIAQEFSQLAKDIQSGNTSAAQQDYTQIQQDFQSQAGQAHAHHHHGGGGGSGEITQLLDQLGQELQSGNASTAQQTYNTLLQDFQQFSQVNGLSATALSGSNSISLSA
jgi:hypothetical protein